MLITSPDREAQIAELNLPDNVLRLTNGKFVHAMLNDDCRPLNLLWETMVSPSMLSVVPLWESHSYVTGFANELSQYIKYDFERPEEHQVLESSIHSVVADLLIWYWTEEEAEDDALREVADLLMFPEIDRLLIEIQDANKKATEPQEEWADRFRRSL